MSDKEPIERLKDRFAEGEISKEEFERKKKILQENEEVDSKEAEDETDNESSKEDGERENNEIESSSMTNKVKYNISYAVSVLIGFTSLGYFTFSFSAGLIMLITALFVNPSIRRKLEDNLNRTFSTGQVLTVVLLGIFVAGMMSAASIDDEVTSNGEQTQTETQPTAAEINEDIKDEISEIDGSWGSHINSVENVSVSTELGEFLEEEGIEVEEDEEFRMVEIDLLIDEPGTLGDDYVAMKNSATEVFPQVFNSHDTVWVVGIYVGKQTKDEYGQDMVEPLGVTWMDRITASEVNWDNFDSDDLDEITDVQFEGDSTVHELQEWREMDSFERQMEMETRRLEEEYYEDFDFE